MADLEIVLVGRSDTINDLVLQCAKGELKFSGPDSLYSKVAEMGFSTNSLYEAVMSVKRTLESET